MIHQKILQFFPISPANTRDVRLLSQPSHQAACIVYDINMQVSVDQTEWKII